MGRSVCPLYRIHRSHHLLFLQPLQFVSYLQLTEVSGDLGIATAKVNKAVAMLRLATNPLVAASSSRPTAPLTAPSSSPPFQRYHAPTTIRPRPPAPTTPRWLLTPGASTSTTNHQSTTVVCPPVSRPQLLQSKNGPSVKPPTMPTASPEAKEAGWSDIIG